MRFSILLPIATLALSACEGSARETAPEKAAVTGEGIGPVAVAISQAQLRRTARVVRDTIELGLEAIAESVAVISVRGDTVRAIIDSGRVYRVTTTAPGLRTSDSLGTGTPLARLLLLPGVYALTAEGAVYVSDPRHCGVSFLLSESGALAEGPDSIGVEQLRSLPAATKVAGVNVFGCSRG